MKSIYSVSTVVCLFILFSCSNKFTGKVTPVGNGWLIKTSIVNKLKENYANCKAAGTCIMPDSFYRFNSQYNYITDHFNSPAITEDTVVYSEADQDTYRILFGFPKRSDTGAVKNYITRILRITFKPDPKSLDNLSETYYSKGTDSSYTVYSYVYQICPPPRPCNGRKSLP